MRLSRFLRFVGDSVVWLFLSIFNAVRSAAEWFLPSLKYQRVRNDDDEDVVKEVDPYANVDVIEIVENHDEFDGVHIGRVEVGVQHAEVKEEVRDGRADEVTITMNKSNEDLLEERSHLVYQVYLANMIYMNEDDAETRSHKLRTLLDLQTQLALINVILLRRGIIDRVPL